MIVLSDMASKSDGGNNGHGMTDKPFNGFVRFVIDDIKEAQLFVKVLFRE